MTRIRRAPESVTNWTSEIIVVLNDEVNDGTDKIDAAKLILFIQPLTSSPKKWPLDNFLEVARHFQSLDAKSFSAAARQTATG